MKLFIAAVVSVVVLMMIGYSDAFRVLRTVPFSAVSSKFVSSVSRLEMAQKDINMPALSSTMKEGKIVSWNKKVGDKVQSGEVLLVVESDKADMDVESFEDGYLAAIYTPEGGTAAVGAAVASLVDTQAEIGQVKGPGSAPAVSAPPAAPAATPAPSTSQSSPSPKESAGAATANFDQILMPALSSTMKEGKIVSWSKKVGDKVSAGDMVLVVESDKADMDVESYEEGYLAAILVADGEAAPVGAPVAYLAKTKEEIAAIQEFVKSGGKISAAAAPTPASSEASTTSSAPAPVSATSAPAAIVNDGRVAASGYAKQVAKDQNIDLRTVTPTRPDQYITSKDLENVASSVEFQLPAGLLSATPAARKLAQENNIDLSKVKGTGNFGRIVPDDILKAAGKYVPPVAPVAVAAAPVASAPADKKASATKGAPTAPAVLDGFVDMNGMQKAVAKNMEDTIPVPIFRISK